MKRAVPGYEMHNKTTGERWRVIGALREDEVHTGNMTGHINVSAMWRDIDAGVSVCQLVSILITPESLRVLENQDIDEMRLAQITPARAEKSCIGIMPLDDGTMALVDGTHRLKWRADHAYKNFSMYAFTPAAASAYCVRFKFKPRGSFWRQVNAEAMLRHMQGRYAILDDAGQMIGMREASPEKIAELQARHDRAVGKSETLR